MRLFFLTFIILSTLNLKSQITIDFEKDTLSILSWNIKMLPGIYYDKHNKQKIAKRSKKITKEIIKKNYDIIIFQEAFNFNSRRIIKK